MRARAFCTAASMVVAAAWLPGQQSGGVDTATLLAPPNGAWVSYGRDYAETHHSPLAQIDTTTVKRLARAWSVEVGSDGKVETTPIIWNGTLYGTSAWSVVYAIDVRTGSLKWRWDPALVRGGFAASAPRFCCGPVNRGVAIYDGRVYAGLLDGRLVALEAETGHVAWAVQTTPPNSDYSITGAPRVVKGMVLIGQGGAEFGVRGFIAAYDAATGAEKWRFYTVPGDPSKGFENDAMARAAKTWTGEWWKYGGGGTPWDAMAYDPDADLLYVGTGNGSPWNAAIRSPGGGDNLFLASIVALRPDTGAYVWHYQTTPGDNWDYNAAQPMVLADLTIDRRRRKVLMQAPKNGFFYVLDRLTGELISGDPFVPVTWATGIDSKSGRPIETAQARYGDTPVAISPSYVGAHHWPPMAWNPATGLVYFPGQETTAIFQRDDPFTFQTGRWNVGIKMNARVAAAASAGGGGRVATTATVQPAIPRARGFFVAWDPLARKPRWRIDFAPSGGALSTAGGLVFAGESSGRFAAMHAETGETLWETHLATGIATPVTYELDGKQFIVVLSGSVRGRVYAFALNATATTGQP